MFGKDKKFPCFLLGEKGKKIDEMWVRILKFREIENVNLRSSCNVFFNFFLFQN